MAAQRRRKRADTSVQAITRQAMASLERSAAASLEWWWSEHQRARRARMQTWAIRRWGVDVARDLEAYS